MKQKEVKVCPICHKKYEEFGNNSYPIEDKACCDECNKKVVIPYRLFLSRLDKEDTSLLIKEKQIELIKPSDKYFTLKELQKAVDGYIEIVDAPFEDYVIVVNEEGLLKGLYQNELAYKCFNLKFVGNVLIVPKKVLEKKEELDE